MRVVPPAKPGPSPTAIVGGMVLVLALVAVGAWFATRPSVTSGGNGPASPSPVPEVSATPAHPDPALETARKLSIEVREILDKASDLMVRAPKTVKKPNYPWREVPEKYKQIVRTVRGKPFERDFWLEHTRWLAVAIARLSSAVSADPENPDAPVLMTVATDNSRGKDYDATIRQVASSMKGPEPIHKLMEICFLLVSGDTKEAKANFDKLPELAKTDENRHEEICRRLTQTLLAYGTKKGAKPLDEARKGLAMVPGPQAPTLEDWQWALILVYASVPSLYHEDFGKKEAGRDVVDRGLALLGRSETAPPAFFAQLDKAMLLEVRRVIRDAGRRGMGFLGPDAGASPPVSDLALGADTARWMVVASEPGNTKEERPLWYSIYENWLVPATPALTAQAKDPALSKVIVELDGVLAARAKQESTGVMSGCRARLALVRGDPAAATKLLEAARAKAESSGFRQDEEQIWQGLDRLGVELKAK